MKPIVALDVGASQRKTVRRSLPETSLNHMVNPAEVPAAFKRRPRGELFFGLHFDFHAEPADTEVGALVTEELVHKIIARTNPDFIQYDCKGHSGIASYPSSVAPQPAHIAGNALAIYRRVTAERGIALYGHFSGIWNTHALESDAAAGVESPNGQKGMKFPHVRSEFIYPLSTFGPHVHRTVIPEMRELIEVYGLDGIWVDADCWATRTDYCLTARRMFEHKFPDAELPLTPADPLWSEWLALQRAQFVKYVRTYASAMHEISPMVQIASNWLHGPIAPEPPGKSGVDFISGDYSSSLPVRSARFNSRYMANVGLPWDLMAWGFYMESGGHWALKETRQLLCEAASVIALGGGFQVYFQPDCKGGFADWQIEKMGVIADFCNSRRAFCHQSESVPQVAVLFDRASHYANHAVPFGPCDMTAHETLVEAIVDSGHSVDVVPDYRLMNDLDRWPVVVVPGWKYLVEETVSALLDYVQRGGSLCVIGTEMIERFISLLAERTGSAPAGDESLPYGDGRITFIRQTPKARQEKAQFEPSVGALGNILNDLYAPIVQYDPDSRLEVVLRRKNQKMIVHLLNTACIEDQVISGEGHDIRVAASTCPDSVWMEPGHQPVEFTWNEESRHITMRIPAFAIHAAVLIER